MERGLTDSGNADVDWKIVLFGGFRAVAAADGATVERFRTQKALLLLARIILCAPATVSREQLGEWLWPDRSPSDQRARLRYELNALRSTLGAEAIRSVGNDFVTLGEGISCAPEPATIGYWVLGVGSVALRATGILAARRRRMMGKRRIL